MSDVSSRYILYRTVATDTEAKGYIINAFVWDGTGPQLPIPENTSIATDHSGIHPIGSIYTAIAT